MNITNLFSVVTGLGLFTLLGTVGGVERGSLTAGQALCLLAAGLVMMGAGLCLRGLYVRARQRRRLSSAA